MGNEILKHKLAYFVLAVGILTFIFYFFAVWPNRLQQQLAIGSFGVFYFSWGIVTHLKSQKLNKRVVFEYLAVSLLISLLLGLVTL
jgi:hypothetical protein